MYFESSYTRYRQSHFLISVILPVYEWLRGCGRDAVLNYSQKAQLLHWLIYTSVRVYLLEDIMIYTLGFHIICLGNLTFHKTIRKMGLIDSYQEKIA